MACQGEAKKPLNPYAEPYYSPLLKPPHQEVGFPRVYGHPQIPSSIYLPEPTEFPHCCPPVPPVTYHPSGFAFYTPILHHMEVAHHVPEESRQGQTGKSMVANTKRLPRWCQRRRQPSMAVREHYGNVNRWKPKKRVLRDDNSTSVGHPIIPFPTTIEEAQNSRTTTVMIKNIPYHYQRENLLLMLDKHCIQQNTSAKRPSLRSMYDFVYLPMDYKKFAREEKQANLGYAFVNFTTARAAFQFYQQFNGYKWVETEKWKACEVTKAQFQGKEELIEKFQRKTFRCVNPSFRPVEFRPPLDGVNSEIREILVGRFEKGLPNTGIGRQINKTMLSIYRTY